MQAFILGFMAGAFGIGGLIAIYLGSKMIEMDDKYRKEVQDILSQLQNVRQNMKATETNNDTFDDILNQHRYLKR